MKNVFKSIIRTPVKTIVFILLIFFCTMFITVSLNLYIGTKESIKQVKSSFKTIGTIEQTKDSVVTKKYWMPITKEYITTSNNTYKDIVPLSVLDSLPYKTKPTQMPFFYSYNPEISKKTTDIGTAMSIVEFIPTKDFTASNSEVVKIDKWVYTGMTEEIRPEFVNMHDSREPNKNNTPTIFKKGNKYIAIIQNIGITSKINDYYDFYIDRNISTLDDPCVLTSTHTYLASGVAELTPNFYDTEHGKLFLQMGELLSLGTNFLPAIPTNDIDLLMPFHNNQTYIMDGKEFTQEDYDTGEKVCIIPDNIAEALDLSVGDTVDLNLFGVNYFASTISALGKKWFTPISELTKNKTIPPFFYKSTYTIIGTYFSDKSNPNTKTTGYEIGYNGIIIPYKSVSNIENAFVACTGPMQGHNTAFVIENGTNEDFMKAFNKLCKDKNIDNIDINIYDNGYTKIIAGLESISNTSVILLVVGVLSFLGVLILLVFMQVSKDQRSISISRSLGVSKFKCAIQMMTSVGIIVVAGILLGVTAGYFASFSVFSAMSSLDNSLLIDTMYSITQMNTNTNSQVTDFFVNNMYVPFIVFIAAVCICFIISSLFIHSTLLKEPIKLLTERKE